MKRFELRPDGAVERVRPIDGGLQVVEAENKTEAIAKFMQFAFRALENQPKVKIKNGAAQLAYEALTGINVEAWIEDRPFGLCFSGASDWSDLNDSLASFDYYASEAYRSAAQ